MSEKHNELNEVADHQEDVQTSEALRHFRQSVHAWSEAEYLRPRMPKRKRSLFAMGSPALNWAAAAVLAVTVVAVPLVHHQHQEQVESQRKAAEADQKKLASEKQTAYALDDEELLSHVDEDIAQDAPDAMEPLANLMTEKSARR